MPNPLDEALIGTKNRTNKVSYFKQQGLSLLLYLGSCLLPLGICLGIMWRLRPNEFEQATGLSSNVVVYGLVASIALSFLGFFYFLWLWVKWRRS